MEVVRNSPILMDSHFNFPFQQHRSVNWGLCLKHAWVEEKMQRVRFGSITVCFLCLCLLLCLRVFGILDAESGRSSLSKCGEILNQYEMFCIHCVHSEKKIQ